MIIKAKQVMRPLAAFVRVTGLTCAAGQSSFNVSALLHTKLLHAGEGGNPVANIQSIAGQSGVLVDYPQNRCKIYDNGNLRFLTDENGHIVFGRLTTGGPGIWTLNLFSRPSANEQNFSFDTDTVVAFDFPYVFSLGTLPYTAFLYDENAEEGGDLILHEVYLKVGLPGNPSPGDTGWNLVDCAGNVLTGKVLHIYRERFRLIEQDGDFTYNANTGQVAGLVPLAPEERLIVEAWDPLFWVRCTITGMGGTRGFPYILPFILPG